MNHWWLVIIITLLIVVMAAFIWMAVRLGQLLPKTKEDTRPYDQTAKRDVEHIFNDEFREELRNRGRLHFEKIIGENAMFLQQDLQLTTAQLNDYLKQEIAHKLQEEFAKYEQSINDAKQLAVDSIERTNRAVEDQRQNLSAQVEKEYAEEKNRIIKRFETDTADIINHYVLQAIGNQIDLNDQLEFILSDLEANKKAIIEDMVNVP